MKPMWFGPALYVVVSVFLWQYGSAVFFPEVVARRIVAVLPGMSEVETLLTINVALIYFAIYIVFGLFWSQLRTSFKSPYLGAAALFAVNVLIFYPMIGRGILGYRLPQGWIGVCLPLLVSHWLFARGIQFQQRQLD